MTQKQVASVEEYGRDHTEEVEVKTRDGWFYVFQRPKDNEPFVFKESRRPDGSVSERRNRTPQKVVEYMESTYDCGNLHPQFEQGDPHW